MRVMSSQECCWLKEVCMNHRTIHALARSNKENDSSNDKSFSERLAYLSTNKHTNHSLEKDENRTHPSIPVAQTRGYFKPHPEWKSITLRIRKKYHNMRKNKKPVYFSKKKRLRANAARSSGSRVFLGEYGLMTTKHNS